MSVIKTDADTGKLYMSNTNIDGPINYKLDVQVVSYRGYIRSSNYNWAVSKLITNANSGTVDVPVFLIKNNKVEKEETMATIMANDIKNAKRDPNNPDLYRIYNCYIIAGKNIINQLAETLSATDVTPTRPKRNNEQPLRIIVSSPSTQMKASSSRSSIPILSPSRSISPRPPPIIDSDSGSMINPSKYNLYESRKNFNKPRGIPLKKPQNLGKGGKRKTIRRSIRNKKTHKRK